MTLLASDDRITDLILIRETVLYASLDTQLVHQSIIWITLEAMVQIQSNHTVGNFVPLNAENVVECVNVALLALLAKDLLAEVEVVEITVGY